MADYVTIEEARSAPGLRLVLTGIPGAPWTEAAKAVFNVKRIPYLRVGQRTGRTDAALRDWTGFVNAPIALQDDERPRTRWDELLHLAERLAPEPALIPGDSAERARMFGLANELMGEDGLLWCRRLLMFEGAGAPDSPLAGFLALRGRDYGFDPDHLERASARVVEVLELFSALLSQQRAAGARYLMGDGLTALDLYWATAAVIVAPLPHDLCALPGALRASYETYPAAIAAALDPALLAHRDFIYERHLTLPVD